MYVCQVVSTHNGDLITPVSQVEDVRKIVDYELGYASGASIAAKEYKVRATLASIQPPFSTHWRQNCQKFTAHPTFSIPWQQSCLESVDALYLKMSVIIL